MKDPLLHYQSPLSLPPLCKKKKKSESLELVCQIAQRIQKHHGTTLIVGGYARDLVMQHLKTDVTPKDIDLEIHGIDIETIKTLLKEFGPINIVGEQFQVIKIHEIDIAIPRTESKKGKGHRGFKMTGEPFLDFWEASKRRDFTVNALALDPLTGNVFDAHKGINDIKQKILRAVDETTFPDDPLRVLRAMQLAARLDFTIDPETITLCQKINLKELPKERIGEEWQKMLVQSPKPSKGLKYAKELQILQKLHPELEAIIGVPQNLQYHPEGDVWTHTCLAVDAAARIVSREQLRRDEALVVLLSALCHDIGKATTTKKIEDRWTSYDHEKEGLPPARTFMKTTNIPKNIQEKVLTLIENHLFIIHAPSPTDRAIRRLSKRLYPASIQELAWLMEADYCGKTLKQERCEESSLLLERAEALQVQESKPKQLVQGRDLLPLGIQTGPQMGSILKRLYEAQLDGEFTTTEEGLKYYKKIQK